MLKERIVTGLVLAAVALAAVLWLPLLALAVALAIVSLIGLWEWSDLAGLQSTAARIGYCVLGAAGLVGLAGITPLSGAEASTAAAWLLGGTAAAWVLAALGVKGYPASAAWWGSRAARAAIGLVAVLPTWLAFVLLLGQPDGRVLILFLVALVACADIGAFGVGRRFGRRKLAPAVSPGKSWEGFWGGMATGVVFATLIWWLFWNDWISWPALITVVIVTILASVTGDLLESMAKRLRGVKDSSNLLPGHGGVLDRLDSLCAAAPVFAFGLLLAGA